MKTYEVTFVLPTGFIGADICDEREYEFDDEVSESEAKSDIMQDFEDWLDEEIDQIRWNAYVDWSERSRTWFGDVRTKD